MSTRVWPELSLKLSRVGLGMWAMGGKWWGDDIREERSIAAIKAAVAGGINWFDTAPLYGHGHADELLRKVFGKELREYFVATKVGVEWSGDGEHARSNLRPEHVRADAIASLKRLGLEQIPLLKVHWPCELGTPLDDTLEELEKLQQEGKVRMLGLCNYGPKELAQARGKIKLFGFQTPYSLLRREFERELRPVVLQERDAAPLGVFVYETLCRGLLSGKFTRPPRFPTSDLRHRDPRFSLRNWQQSLPLLGAMQVAARKLGLTPASMAIGWALAQGGVDLAIVGAKGPEQVKDHLAAMELAGQERLFARMTQAASKVRF